MDADALIDMPGFRDAVERRFGAVAGVTRLGGMSGAGVWRLTLASGRTVIAKASRERIEAEMYRRIAPRMRDQGVPMPTREWTLDQQGIEWLFLEDIATPPAPGTMAGRPRALRDAAPVALASLERVPPYRRRLSPWLERGDDRCGA